MNLNDYEDKYENFDIPLMYVKVSGRRIEDEDLAYTDLYVETTMGIEASLCRFTIVARNTLCTDDGKLKVSSSLKGKFNLGNEISVYIGYNDDSKLKQIFDGYITSINFEYTGREEVSYTIESMDLKVFMMNNFRSELKKDMKRYSDVVSDILKNYSSLYKSKKIDRTQEIETFIEQHNQSDYDFIVFMARKIDYKFFVINGEVKFIDYTKLKGSILTVSPGKYLYSFEREISLNKQLKKVVVRTNSEKNPNKSIEGSAVSVTTVGKGRRSGSEITKLINGTMQRTIIDNSVKSESQAKSRAQAELNRMSMDLVSGVCKIVGIPELEPGKFITVKNIDSDIDSDYLITGVEHIFNYEGYKTICKFGANKV